MEIKQAIELIHRYETGHLKFVSDYETSVDYYKCKNDILKKRRNKSKTAETIRNADNRIPSAFYPMLVDQKAAYITTNRILFDTGDKQTNDIILETLGEKWPRICNNLVVDASNAGVAWLHAWKEDGAVKYAVVDPAAVVPIYSTDLEKKLIGALHFYRERTDAGEEFNVYEFWDDEHIEVFRKKGDKSASIENVSRYESFLPESEVDEHGRYRHDFADQKVVPFFPCYNNPLRMGDLWRIKEHIDAYDKVASGLINDLEDIQEVILILSGYGGEDLTEFLKNLSEYKVIKSDPTSDIPNPNLSTLTIDIPVAARETAMERERRAIFEDGMGVDTNPEAYGNASGVALQHLYGLLKLKSGMLETQFREAFADFVRLICADAGKTPKYINQTWTRDGVRNEIENVEIAARSQGIVSKKTILRHHPFVTDVEEELKQIEKERAETEAQMNMQYFGRTERHTHEGTTENNENKAS